MRYFFVLFINIVGFWSAFGTMPDTYLLDKRGLGVPPHGFTKMIHPQKKLSARDTKIVNHSIGIAILLELSSGPELGMVENGCTGAIVEELIKTIEQEIIIITSSILLTYLKLLMDKKLKSYEMLQKHLDKYLFFQSEQDNFILLIPRRFGNLSSLGFNETLKPISFTNFSCQSVFEIDLNELGSIFNIAPDAMAEKKFIYLSGHGTPITWNNEPLIANLKLNQYKEFISLLNQINCTILFVSSCYASGLNMVNVHSDLTHGFSIVIGNLTDSFSSFHATINFKKYFSNLSIAFNHLNKETDLLHSYYFKKALAKICGSSVNNTPWIRLKNSEKFLMLNLNNNYMINYDSVEQENKSIHHEPPCKSKVIVVKNKNSLLLCSIAIPRTVKISGKKFPEIISAVPGQSYHEFRKLKTKNQTLNELINGILKIQYEFAKVFFFKRVIIRKPKRRPQKFKIITLKNLLIINHGAQRMLAPTDFFRNNEIYFEKGTHYHHIQIPAGLKLGYSAVESDKIPLQNKKTIIDNFLKSSKPSDLVLKSIGEFL